MVNKYIRKVNNEDGFTLAELLVVIAIMGILSAIAVPYFLGQRQNTADNNLKLELELAATSVNEWKMNHPKSTIGASALDGIKVSEGNSITFVENNPDTGYVLCGKNPNGKVGATGYVFRQKSNGTVSKSGISEEPC